MLVGGVDDRERTDGRWVIAPGLKDAYQAWGDVPGRTMHFDERDGPGQIEFSDFKGFVRVPDFPSGRFPSIVYRRPRRTFDAERWRRWRTEDLPRFTEDATMVWRIEDHLYQIGRDTIGWETRVFAVPPQARVVGPAPPARLRPWMGLGTVEQSSAKGPWIRAKLPGFADGEDVANVRLTTPFSGTDGREGLHFVPAQGTEIKLGWSGRFDNSVLLLGNARSQETTFASPALYLEDTYTSQFKDIDVKRVGQVTVESSLMMGVKEQTRLDSADQLRIHADGADLKMTGGVVYTGRGF
jgi:hypothetical protein